MATWCFTLNETGETRLKWQLACREGPHGRAVGPGANYGS